MAQHVNHSATSKFQAVESSELQQVGGGIWDYSNRLGILGQMLEDRQDRPYGNPLAPPKNLDEAAGRALQNWVSIP